MQRRTPQPTAAASSSPAETIEPSTETSATQTAPVSEIPFSFVSAQGWSYSGTLPVPQVSVTFSKDISSSPPGQARLVSAIVGQKSATELPTFGTDDPSRPNGPELKVRTLGLLVKSDATTVDAFADQFAGACGGVNGTIQGWWPYPYAVICNLLDAPTSGESEDLPESVVDQLATISFAEPVLYFSFGAPDGFARIADECDVFVTIASGEVVADPEPVDGCGVFRVR